MRKVATAVALVWAGAAMAQDRTAEPRIDLVASGSVELAPEVATIRYAVRGEGASAEAAIRALVTRKDAIARVLGQFGDTKLELTTGSMEVQEVRGRECQRIDSAMPRLSTGVCAIQGFVAEIGVTVKVIPVARAGTLTGAIAQAGGTEVSLADFGLIDPAAARRKAIAAAMANGKAQAEAIAAASGSRLGRLLRVSDGDMRDVIVAEDISTFPDRNVAEAVQLIPVTIMPDKVTVSARLTLSFEIAR